MRDRGDESDQDEECADDHKTSTDQLKARRSTAGWIAFAAILAAICSLSLYSYLLFHTFAELFSIIIAMTYAVIAWHSRETADGSPIGALGISYFFVAVLDVFHTLAFAGMGVFTGYAFPANQVWVVARLLEAAALCSFGYFNLMKRGRLWVVIGACAAVTVAGLAAIFVFRVFPACFVAGKGQTPFKVAAEIVIIGMLICAAIVLRAHRGRYSRPIYLTLQSSIAATALSELSFMVYVHNFDLLNMAGHVLKIISFYLVYRAVVVTCLERPQELLFERLQRAARELRESNEAKDSFISILSHDLRGPLSGISSLASSFALDGQRSEAAREREALAMITQASDTSLQLVERVLAWAQVRGGTLEPDLRMLDVREVAESELSTLAELARAKGVVVGTRFGEETKAFADASMLGTVVRNLVQNAVKFTPPGGMVTVATRGSGGFLVMEVSDTGVGIPAPILELLFKPDKRISTYGTAGEKGSGFGLVLCAEFASRMGGKLTVASEQGKGSVFSLSLPAAPER